MNKYEKDDMTLWVDQHGHLWGYDNQGQMREWSFNDYGDLYPLEEDDPYDDYGDEHDYTDNGEEQSC